MNNSASIVVSEGTVTPLELPAGFLDRLRDHIFERRVSIAVCLSLLGHVSLVLVALHLLVVPPRISFAGGGTGIEVSLVPYHEGGAARSSAQPEDPGAGRAPVKVELRAEPEPLRPVVAPRAQLRPADRVAPVSTGQTSPSDAAGAATSRGSAGDGESQAQGDGGAGVGATFGGGGGGSGASLLAAPKPPYPRGARLAGFEGRVVLDVTISPDGTVSRAGVAHSSGRTDCDESALKTVRERWRFQPATFAGRPIEWRQKVAIRYDLR